jgi:chromosome segregation ATPase
MLVQKKVIGKAGRKPEVTIEQIVDAAKGLQVQGRRVTGYTLRDYLGFGGPKFMLEEWEKYLSDNGELTTITQPAELEYILPPELEDKIKLLIGDISKQLNDFANESDSLANRIAEKKARSAYDTMMKNNKILVEEQDLASTILVKADARIEELQEANEELEQRLSEAKSQTFSLKSNNASQLKDIVRLESEIKVNHAKLQTLSNINQELEKTVIRLETKLDDATKTKDSSIKEMRDINAFLNASQIELKEKLIMATTALDTQVALLLEKDRRNSNLEEQLAKYKS